MTGRIAATVPLNLVEIGKPGRTLKQCVTLALAAAVPPTRWGLPPRTATSHRPTESCHQPPIPQ